LPFDPIYSPGIKAAKSSTDITGKNIISELKSFVIHADKNFVDRDWKVKTQEFIKLCHLENIVIES